MGKYISFESRIRYNKYILLTILFYILYNFSYGYNHNNSFIDLRINFTHKQEDLFFHENIHQTYCFIILFLFSLGIYKYELKHNRDKKHEHNLTTEKIEDKQFSSQKIILFDLFIIFLLVLKEILIFIFMKLLKDLDFWMLELLIMYYFVSRIYHIKLYKHQIFALGFIIIPCILKIITIYLSSINNDGNELPILYIEYKWLIPLGIIIYLFLIIIEAYSLTKIKQLMDLRYISPSKILIIYGLLGTFFYLIISVISTFFKCNEVIKEYICGVKGENEFFYENIFLYFNKFEGDLYEIFIEILSNLFGVIFFSLNKYFALLVIKFLSPIHVIFLNPIIFFIQKISLALKTMILEGSFFKNPIQNAKIKLILDASGDILSIIGFMIYLEIIELKFCGYNYDIRKEIVERSELESNLERTNKSFIFLEDGDIEECSNDEKSEKSSSTNRSIEFKKF